MALALGLTINSNLPSSLVYTGTSNLTFLLAKSILGPNVIFDVMGAVLLIIERIMVFVVCASVFYTAALCCIVTLKLFGARCLFYAGVGDAL